MATTGVGFRWLDLLEKEFDKACVELDTSLAELEAEEPEVAFTARQKIATLGSCFSQLTHKALTIFQNSAKMEAELVDIRAELVQARAASAGSCRESGDAAGNVTSASRARAEAAQLARENAALRETVLALHSELFGARLATKYLDKELAGRIQQLQLLGKDMRSEVRDSLWAQVEAEILLQRHKTLVRVCRGLSPWPARPPIPTHSLLTTGGDSQRARARTVRVRRSPHLGLGISVTGGREHGVPILISELEAGGPAALTGQLYVGDAILAINDVDLTQACHKEAVHALQSVKGDCALCVQFIATDDDDRLSEDNYRFPLYPEDGEVFEREPDGSGATPTAPRTPDYNRRDSDVDAVSEAESEGAPPALPAPAPAPYPDYNNINNNLNILDMDDDSIKIETRLEWGARVVGLSNHRYSSGESPRSTPVHARSLQPKKKRKPQDCRTKGAYRAVDLEAPSSDDPHPDASHDITSDSPDVLDSPAASPPSPVEPLINVADSPLINVADSPLKQPLKPSLPQATLPQAILPQVTLPPAILPQVTLSQVSLPMNLSQVTLSQETVPQVTLSQVSLPMKLSQVTLSEETVPQVTLPQVTVPQVTLPQVTVPQVTLPEVQPTATFAMAPTMLNGDVKPAKREKGFRIGSARRVVEGALSNGEARGKFARLRTGDGDPDFGTPV